AGTGSAGTAVVCPELPDRPLRRRRRPQGPAACCLFQCVGAEVLLPPRMESGLMRILLTGASGFIGGHLLPQLLQAGHEVRARIRRPESAAAISDAMGHPLSIDGTRTHLTQTMGHPLPPCEFLVGTLPEVAGDARLCADIEV